MEREQRRLERLLEELRGARRLLILTHDNPDPDAIAAGWVLAHIARRLLGLRATLAYEGVVGRAENRAMVNLLRIPLVRLCGLDPERFDAVALIDTQPGAGNNSLPRGRVPHVVFDHHGLRRATRHVPWADVRTDYGATATILTEYLLASGLPLTRRHATGLFYAIRSETQNLKREGAGPDLKAFLTLFPRTDSRLIGRIEQAPIPRSYLALLQGAFRATRLHGELSITRLGRLPYPDVVAELADLLLRIDEVHWAMTMGRYRGSIYISLRAQAPRANAAREIQRVCGHLGKAGGHGQMAGGRIDVRAERLDLEKTESEIVRRARALLGRGARGRRLLAGECPGRPR